MGLINKLIGTVTHDPEPEEGTFPLPVDEYTIPDNDDNNAHNKHPDAVIPPKPKPAPRKKRRS